jgi:hypothetical protein
MCLFGVFDNKMFTKQKKSVALSPENLGGDDFCPRPCRLMPAAGSSALATGYIFPKALSSLLQLLQPALTAWVEQSRDSSLVSTQF